MEAHKCICKRIIVLALDILVIYVLGNGVVDIKQCNSVSGNAHTDIFAQCAVDINLAGYGDSAAYKSAVYIAGLKSELGGECGPALVSECNVLSGALMVFCPV